MARGIPAVSMVLPPACSDPSIVRSKLIQWDRQSREGLRVCIEEAARDCSVWNSLKAREKHVILALKASGKAGWFARVDVAVEFWTVIGSGVEENWLRHRHGEEVLAQREVVEAVEKIEAEETAAPVVEDFDREVEVLPAVPGNAVQETGADVATDIRRDMRWCYENMGKTLAEVKKLKPPSRGAMGLLRAAMADKDAFYTKFMTVFAREADEQRRKTTDDGRQQISLVDDIRIAADRANREERMRADWRAEQ